MTIRQNLVFFILAAVCVVIILYLYRSVLISGDGMATFYQSLIGSRKQPSTIESIRHDCGQLCNTSNQGFPGPYFDHVRAHIDCRALFKNEYVDKGHGLPHAPKEIPKDLMKDFTMNFRMSVTPVYFDERYLGKQAQTPIWTVDAITKYIKEAKDGTLKGNYGSSDTNALQDGIAHAPGIKNGRVLIIGSEWPWVEACVLAAGAHEVVTLEYGRIVSQHSQVKAMVPYDFRKSYLNNTLGLFDAVVTFGSVEHSGLGRYGDALNPWGDIITIARSWCVTKQDGSLTIGAKYSEGKDFIKFNAGRWYGKLRYPYLATNWKQHYRGGGPHRVHVFTKSDARKTTYRGRSPTTPTTTTKRTTQKTTITTQPVVSHKLKSYLAQPHPYRKLNNTNIKYSQAHQDVTVYNLFKKENGVFIEMGAYNGISLSNTMWLEKHHNWTGLLIEANPELCKQIDALKRHAWRFCACISNTMQQASFVKGGAVGGVEKNMNEHHFKTLPRSNKVIVPCFTLIKVLNEIKSHHIDYFSLDVEGAELAVLNSMKEDLKSGKIVVDVWTIEYRVWDGTKVVIDASLKNLKNLRVFFREVGNYVEHSKLSNDGNLTDELALDVVFVNTKSWCAKHATLPDSSPCQ